MAEERYDIVIIGAGHNGVTAAAYLSKCGLRVCVLEEKAEAGGACETAEPLSGVRIFPHAMLMYAAPAPGFRQLELWKYGFRMSWSPVNIMAEMEKGGFSTTEGVVSMTQKDMIGFSKLSGLLTTPAFTGDLLRATFWCPPHPPEVEINENTIPYMQVYKQRQPDVWSKELLQMTLFDLLDEYVETEAFKVTLAASAWWSGAAGHYEGVAIPALMCVVTLFLGSLISMPRGGMHAYFHAIMRCALDHGAVIRTACPVEEIIVRNGRAAGVRLREDAACKEKRIWADKAVISATDIRQTFLKLIGPQHLDASLIQRIKDISLKGGSLYVSHFLTRKPIRYKPKWEVITEATGLSLYGCAYPTDSREIYYDAVADVDAWKGNPRVPPERALWFMTPSQSFDRSSCHFYHPKGHVSPAFEMAVTPPEYHVEGIEATDKIKKSMDAYMRQAFSQMLDGFDDDNIIYHWSATPHEVEFRNSGLIGGTWCGTRHCKDQLWTNRPLPELARYRVPGIEGLYLCHQTSGHPGGLCLMAIPYNLMHILIEDGIAQPGDWWYPSPWYIPEKGKTAAAPGKK